VFQFETSLTFKNYKKMSESKFCSTLCQQSGEPLAGTAPFAEHIVFITWPKKFWEYEALESKGGFPTGLKKWMKEKSKICGKISIRLASRAELGNDKVEIFIYPGKKYFSNVLPKEIPEILELNFQPNISSNLSYGKFENDQIFICTHGRHDKCCAKFGQKLADQMRYFIQKQNLPIEVWESSHLGGHRFAATMIDFPSGRVYGRMTPYEIPKFLESRKRGLIYSSAYRGSLFLQELEQVAEAHIQHFCSIKQLNCHVKIKKMEKLVEDKFRCVVALRTNDSFSESQKTIPDELTFSFKMKEFESPSGCDTLEDPQKRKGWELDLPLSFQII